MVTTRLWTICRNPITRNEKRIIGVCGIGGAVLFGSLQWLFCGAIAGFIVGFVSLVCGIGGGALSCLLLRCCRFWGFFKGIETGTSGRKGNGSAPGTGILMWWCGGVGVIAGLLLFGPWDIVTHIRLNPDVFMNPYLVGFLLANTAIVLLGGVRLTQHALDRTKLWRRRARAIRTGRKRGGRRAKGDITYY